MNADDRELALAQAENLQKMLGQTIPRIDPSTEHFEQACNLYAQTVIIKLRLSPTTPSF